jgi:RES domain-containing protein
MGQHVVPVALPARVFRIARQDHARTPESALSGLGGEKSGGRWHTIGQRVTYCASSRALCLLERVVHGDEWLTDIAHDRVYLDIDLQLDLGSVSSTFYTADELDDYDRDWRREGSPFCRMLGDKWLSDRSSYALLVPSVVVPEEYNILLNPRHPINDAIIRLNTPLVTKAVRVDDRFGEILDIKAGAAR